MGKVYQNNLGSNISVAMVELFRERNIILYLLYIYVIKVAKNKYG